MSWFNPTTWDWAKKTEHEKDIVPVIDVDNPAHMRAQHNAHMLEEHLASHDGTIDANYGGQKFAGGMTSAKVYEMDFWQLRIRSKQLFVDNLYARGLIRALVSNEITTGLKVESTPEEEILGRALGSLGDWSEKVENLFNLYAGAPKLCDWKRILTNPKLQRRIKFEAYVYGDVLVVFRIDPITKLPRVQLINAGAIQNPSVSVTEKNIVHGVELGDNDEHIAYHIVQADGVTTLRLPVVDPKTGFDQCRLVYGNDVLEDDVRGAPMLSLIMQSISEMDKYRDSTQRQALIASFFVGFIKKTTQVLGSLPLDGAAVKKTNVAVTDDTGDTAGNSRNYKIADFLPGTFMQSLQAGEEPEMFGGDGTDINFPVFEEAIINAIAWSQEMPPELLKKSFSSNYSASQAAINEYKSVLEIKRLDMQAQFLKPLYIWWFYGQVLTAKILAPGFIAALNDPLKYDIVEAWLSCDWTGAVKPTTDTVKQGKGHELQISMGLITRDRASKEATGTKFSKNVKQLRRENEQLADSMEPILKLQQKYGETAMEGAAAGKKKGQGESAEAIDEILAEEFVPEVGETYTRGGLDYRYMGNGKYERV